MLKKSAGITIIELLLVLSLMTAIGTFSVVIFSRFLTQVAVANAQDHVVTQLRKAQLYSMMGKQNGSWGVHLSGSTLTIFQGSSFAARNSAFDETVTENTNVNISGLSDVVFAKTTGVPSTTLSVSIVGGTTSTQVTLNGEGMVSR